MHACWTCYGPFMLQGEVGPCGIGVFPDVLYPYYKFPDYFISEVEFQFNHGFSPEIIIWQRQIYTAVIASWKCGIFEEKCGNFAQKVAI